MRENLHCQAKKITNGFIFIHTLHYGLNKERSKKEEKTDIFTYAERTKMGNANSAQKSAERKRRRKWRNKRKKSRKEKIILSISSVMIVRLGKIF